MITKAQKQKTVESLKKDLKEYPTIAIASVSGLPSKQFNAIKKKTRKDTKMALSRLTLVRRAIEEGRPELKALVDKLGNSTVVIFSNLDAFKLYKLFKQNKSKTAAKAGQLAPSDIVIPAGETNLAPGPVLTELKQAKIDAKIQGPKVVISRDATVAKKGEPIRLEIASIMSKLGMEPMEVGFQVLSVYDHGTIYAGEVLNIDDDAFKANLAQAHQAALNLGVFAEIYNEATSPLIVTKAAREARALQAIVEKK